MSAYAGNKTYPEGVHEELIASAKHLHLLVNLVAVDVFFEVTERPRQIWFAPEDKKTTLRHSQRKLKPPQRYEQYSITLAVQVLHAFCTYQRFHVPKLIDIWVYLWESPLPTAPDCFAGQLVTDNDQCSKMHAAIYLIPM